MKKVVVTGGAGFIGSHLCTWLLKNNCYVVCLDNLSTGSLANISHLTRSEYFEFVEHDVCDPIQLSCDEIYHFACPASPPKYKMDPVGTTKTCVLGAINMLDLANDNNATVLLASTSEIYGDPLVHPQPESYLGNVNTIGERGCYNEGKRCAETLFFDYYRQYQTNIKIVRIFNTYGPRMAPDDGRVVSNFIVNSLKGRAIEIYGDGEQTRSFCYIDDMIKGLVALMASDPDFRGPVNMGNPQEYSIADIANIIKNTLNADVDIVFSPATNDDPLKRKPLIDLARKQLAWQPDVAFKDGLVETIAYFKAQLNMA